MQSIDPTMSQKPSSSSSQGHPRRRCSIRLVTRGAERGEAQAYVQQLLALKSQAEAADPARLRADATSMLQQGSDARPGRAVTSRRAEIPAAEADIARLAATVRRLVPCQRCRQPMDPADTYFDQLGNQVCGNCVTKVIRSARAIGGWKSAGSRTPAFSA